MRQQDWYFVQLWRKNRYYSNYPFSHFLGECKLQTWLNWTGKVFGKHCFLSHSDYHRKQLPLFLLFRRRCHFNVDISQARHNTQNTTIIVRIGCEWHEQKKKITYQADKMKYPLRSDCWSESKYTQCDHTHMHDLRESRRWKKNKKKRPSEFRREKRNVTIHVLTLFAISYPQRYLRKKRAQRNDEKRRCILTHMLMYRIKWHTKQCSLRKKRDKIG